MFKLIPSQIKTKIIKKSKLFKKSEFFNKILNCITKKGKKRANLKRFYSSWLLVLKSSIYKKNKTVRFFKKPLIFKNKKTYNTFLKSKNIFSNYYSFNLNNFLNKFFYNNIITLSFLIKKNYVFLKKKKTIIYNLQNKIVNNGKFILIKLSKIIYFKKNNTHKNIQFFKKNILTFNPILLNIYLKSINFKKNYYPRQVL